MRLVRSTTQNAYARKERERERERVLLLSRTGKKRRRSDEKEKKVSSSSKGRIFSCFLFRVLLTFRVLYFLILSRVFGSELDWIARDLQ